MATTDKQSVDEVVMGMLVKVAKKKEEIEKLKVRPQWKTNCTLGRDPLTTQDRVNIQTITNPNVLISLYAFLTQQETLLSDAAKALDLEFDSTWMNYPIEDWKHDLKARSKSIVVKQKLEELKELDKRVNKLVTTEQRRLMEVEALEKLLDD